MKSLTTLMLLLGLATVGLLVSGQFKMIEGVIGVPAGGKIQQRGGATGAVRSDLLVQQLGVLQRAGASAQASYGIYITTDELRDEIKLNYQSIPIDKPLEKGGYSAQVRGKSAEFCTYDPSVKKYLCLGYDLKSKETTLASGVNIAQAKTNLVKNPIKNTTSKSTFEDLTDQARGVGE